MLVCCIDRLNRHPESGQIADVSVCPLWAKSGQTHRSKKHRLFDHLVRYREHLVRHVKAERLGGLEIDLEPSRLGDRQIGGLGAPEDAADIGQLGCSTNSHTGRLGKYQENQRMI